jgi:hypothetical protein
LQPSASSDVIILGAGCCTPRDGPPGAWCQRGAAARLVAARPPGRNAESFRHAPSDISGRKPEVPGARRRDRGAGRRSRLVRVQQVALSGCSRRHSRAASRWRIEVMARQRGAEKFAGAGVRGGGRVGCGPADFRKIRPSRQRFSRQLNGAGHETRPESCSGLDISFGPVIDSPERCRETNTQY